MHAGWLDDQPGRYAIRVRGALAPHWAGWLAPLAITPEPDGTTRLVGTLADQAALYGLISRLRDLGLTLLALERLPADSS